MTTGHAAAELWVAPAAYMMHASPTALFSHEEHQPHSSKRCLRQCPTSSSIWSSRLPMRRKTPSSRSAELVDVVVVLADCSCAGALADQGAFQASVRGCQETQGGGSTARRNRSRSSGLTCFIGIDRRLARDWMSTNLVLRVTETGACIGFQDRPMERTTIRPSCMTSPAGSLVPSRYAAWPASPIPEMAMNPPAARISAVDRTAEESTVLGASKKIAPATRRARPTARPFHSWERRYGTVVAGSLPM